MSRSSGAEQHGAEQRASCSAQPSSRKRSSPGPLSDSDVEGRACQDERSSCASGSGCVAPRDADDSDSPMRRLFVQFIQAARDWKRGGAGVGPAVNRGRSSSANDDELDGFGGRRGLTYTE